jgi:LysM repeat protein
VRVWTKSACVLLAWAIMVLGVVAAGLAGTARPAQAATRTARSNTPVTVAMPAADAAPRPGARPADRYVVQPGDTLSGIAARFALRGGWPALYAANRPRIGPDPDLIRPGTVLVLPGLTRPARYTVAAGDTLAGIAAALGVPGGWPALYAANRAAIGPDPGLIRPGTVLAIPPLSQPAPAPAPAPGYGRRPHPAPPRPHGPQPRPRPRPSATTTGPAGMPRWLKTLLLAVGLLIAVGFLTEPVLALRRRRRTRPPTPTPAGTPSASPPPAGPSPPAIVPSPRIPAPAPGPDHGPARPAAQARIMLADHDRLVVTRSPRDGTVCVLRPPGEDPKAIMRVARLVLPEGSYQALAEHLGLPATWPVILADYDRVVVTRSPCDDTICVLRPPGEDPKAILRAARLVLPEAPYGELADQLGVPASWPLEHHHTGPPG